MKDKHIRRKNKKAGRKKELILFLYLLPSLAGLLLFYGIPYVMMIVYSVLDNPVQKNFIGLDQYRWLFRNRAFLTAFSNMLFFSIGGILTVIPLSLWIASLLEQNTFWNSFVRSSMLLPLFVPAACVILVWRILFDKQGMVNHMLELFGITSVDWLKSAWGRAAVLMMYLWKNTGLIVVIFQGAFAAVPLEQIEVAKLEGAGKWKIFRCVKLHNILPSIVFASIMALISSYKLFREIYLLTGEYPHEKLYLLSHFLNNMLRKMEYGKMSAASVVYALVTAGIMALLFWLDKRKRSESI